MGQVPSRGTSRGNYTLKFLSVFLSPFHSLKNKHIKSLKKRRATLVGNELPVSAGVTAWGFTRQDGLCPGDEVGRDKNRSLPALAVNSSTSPGLLLKSRVLNQREVHDD